MRKRIAVAPNVLAICAVKAERAADLTLEELDDLVGWCNGQDANLWEGMSLQEILNVYRATHADAMNYRKPKNANGSRARYFHAYLCRDAARETRT